MFILLSGMAFESTFLLPGTASYNFLTYMVRDPASIGSPCGCRGVSFGLELSLRRVRTRELSSTRSSAGLGDYPGAGRVRHRGIGVRVRVHARGGDPQVDEARPSHRGRQGGAEAQASLVYREHRKGTTSPTGKA